MTEYEVSQLAREHAELKQLATAAAASWLAWMRLDGFDNPALPGMRRAQHALAIHLDLSPLTGERAK
jgi:hypothetical protein